MAKDIKPINLDEENETTDDEMSNDSLGAESTDEIINDTIEEATPSTEEVPVETIEEDTEGVLENVAVEEEKITDAQEVQNVMLTYFSKKTGKTIKKFFEVFLRATDEYPDLSMQDYKSFLETIEQNVPESDYPKYKELFAKVLVARKKRIQKYDQQKMLEAAKAETLKEIEDTYQQVDRSKYVLSGLTAIEKAYGNAKNQVEQENNVKNLNLISKSFESSIKSAKTKKQAKRKKIFIFSGVFAAVVLLAAILCIGAIPKINYKTVSTTKDLVYNKNGEYEQITVKSVLVEGISGLFLPFHYPMKTVDLRGVSDQKCKLVGIADGAFKGESSIEVVYIPYDITIIPEEAFANCKNLKEINYFEGTNDLSYITNIEANAFKGCTSLESIKITNRIVQIDRTAFTECSSDFSIHFAGDTATWTKKYIYPGVTVEFSVYHITAVDGNTTHAVLTVEPGEKFNLGGMHYKTGYTAKGYYYNNIKIAGTDGKSLSTFTYYRDITVTMVYTPNQYTIKMSDSSISNSVTYDSSFVLPTPSNTSSGVFIGWYYGSTQLTDADGKSLEPYNYAESITVTPKFQSSFVVSYKGSEVLVKFNSNGGTTVPNQKVTLNNPLTYPPIPTKAGYIFAGWYKDSSLSTAFNFTETLSSDLTLYAKWISPTKPYESIVSLNSTTGTTVAYTPSLKYYAFVPLVTQTIKVYSTGSGDVKGFIYNHYLAEMKRDDDSGTGNNFEMTYTVYANTLYYIGVQGYSSSGTCQLYLTGDKTTPTVTSQISSTSGFTKTVTYGSNYTLQVLSRPGLTFKGYYLEPTFNTKITDATGASLAPWTYTEDITVYAKYE